MILTKEQKEDLKQLKKMPWFKVLELIEKEANDELFWRLATFDIDDEKDRNTIKQWQIYQRARTDFFNNTESYLREIYEPKKIPWIDYD